MPNSAVSGLLRQHEDARMNSVRLHVRRGGPRDGSARDEHTEHGTRRARGVVTAVVSAASLVERTRLRAMMEFTRAAANRCPRPRRAKRVIDLRRAGETGSAITTFARQCDRWESGIGYAA